MKCLRCGESLEGVEATQCPECLQPFNPADPETYDSARDKRKSKAKDDDELRPALLGEDDDDADVAGGAWGGVSVFWMVTCGLVYIGVAVVTLALAGDAVNTRAADASLSVGGIVWRIVGFPMLSFTPPVENVWDIAWRVLINAFFWGFTVASAIAALKRQKESRLPHVDPDD